MPVDTGLPGAKVNGITSIVGVKAQTVWRQETGLAFPSAKNGDSALNAAREWYPAVPLLNAPSL